MSTTTERRTHRPSGLPSWPVFLLCGVEKSGKTDKCAEASRSELIDRTFWINFGEDEPSEYDPNIYPFEVVEHDGSHRDVLAAIEWAKAQPAEDGKVNLIVFDSGSRYWTMLSDAAQQTANERWRRKNPNSRFPEDPIKVTPDLWNIAGDRWAHLVSALKEHQGPVVITSRLDLVTEFENDQPTKNKTWQHKVQRMGPSDVAAIIHMRLPYPEHDDWLMGVRSKRYKFETDANGKVKITPLPEDWSIEGLWRAFGLAETAAAARIVSSPVVEGEAAEQQRIAAERQEFLTAIAEVAPLANIALGVVAGEYARTHDGQSIEDATDLAALENIVARLRARAEQLAQSPAQGDAQQGAQAPAQDARADEAPARADDAQPAAQPPAEDARPAPAAVKESAKDKTLRIAGDELALQADALGVEYVDHAKPATGANGDLLVSKAGKYVISQRAATIEAMRAAGRDAEADAYARIGSGFPIELHIIFEGVEDAEDRAAAQPREDARG